MVMTAENRIWSDPAWVTYITPFRLIVPDGEVPIESSLDEINGNTYNHGKLSKIVGTLPLGKQDLKDFKILLCYDGGIALPRYKSLSQKEDAVLLFNKILCNFLVGGIYCEAVDVRDVVCGQLYKKEFIWPVDYGGSASSQLHASLRTKVASLLQAAELIKPRAIFVSDIRKAFNIGEQITSIINNLTPQFLIRGATELQNKNWSSAISLLWTCVEQMSEFLWEKKFIANCERHPKQPLSGRIKSFQNDNQTWPISVKQEMLFQTGIINDITFANIYPARQARNRLVHKGDYVDPVTVFNLFDGVCQMLSLCSGIADLPLSKSAAPQSQPDQDGGNRSMEDNPFEQWLSHSKN